MNDDEMRDRLGTVHYAHYVRSSGPGFIECSCGWTGVFHPDHVADKLLPTVRGLIADEVESIRRWLHDYGLLDPALIQMLRRRADALAADTGTEPRP